MHDRRAHPRLQTQRPVKVYHPLSRGYSLGETIDLSSGGAMLMVNTGRRLLPGDEIDVAIVWDRRAVIPRTELVPVTVVRVAARSDERQAVAVRFRQRLGETAAAAA